jgi:hypothetical protein
MLQRDDSMVAETADVSELKSLMDSLQWKCETEVQKFEGDISWEMDNGLLVPTQDGDIVAPYDVVEHTGNMLVYGGSSIQWQTLIGNGTTTAGQELTYFNNANAAIGVGDSSTAAALTQTALQAATNRLYKAMDATYPLHTDSDSSAGARDCVFRSTFATGDANWAWNEWGVFNSTTHNTGRMMNRVASAGLLGTKTSSATWVLTVTLTMS